MQAGMRFRRYRQRAGEQPALPFDLHSFTAPRSALSLAADGATFLIAGTAPFIIHLAGDLPVADVLLLPLMPFLVLLHPERLARKHLRPLFLLLALWLFAQAISDIYHGSEMSDWMRTDARIVLWAVGLVSMSVLAGRNLRRHVIFFAGYALGSALVIPLQPNEFTDVWKFGYSTGVTYAILLVSCYFFHLCRNAIVISLLLAAAAIHMLFNYRSPVLFLFITIALIAPIIPDRIGRLKVLRFVGSSSRVPILALLAIVAGSLAAGLVFFLASRGALGQEAMEKNQSQAGAKGGLLLGGRPAILVSSRAVMDSPLIGHGSWARDVTYVEMYHDLRVKYGIAQDSSDNANEEEHIPTHSHLMDAWVEAGIMGAIVWIYVFCLAARGAMQAANTKPMLAPMYVYSFAALLWAILFSPPGGITILPETFVVIAACDLLEGTSLPRRGSAPFRMYSIGAGEKYAARVL